MTMRAVLTFLVRTYQFLLRPWLGARCRFTPSCSDYAIDALRIHGAVHGTGLILMRLARCHPWHSGGHDPVPEISVSGEACQAGSHRCKHLH